MTLHCCFVKMPLRLAKALQGEFTCDAASLDGAVHVRRWWCAVEVCSQIQLGRLPACWPAGRLAGWLAGSPTCMPLQERALQHALLVGGVQCQQASGGVPGCTEEYQAAMHRTFATANIRHVDAEALLGTHAVFLPLVHALGQHETG
jgi:hypothetical protein